MLTMMELTGRDRALLRAVGSGRCSLLGGCEPLLLIDGLACADSGAARRLVRAGLIAPPAPGRHLGPAELTPTGAAVLAEHVAAR
ncbi:MAG TPA: hypothetical protein VM367_14555 [Pseudonocardia sp.]|jgi:hypothetical protein|nr:hypothetical protein [Pseudonocardia sp.]